MVNADFWRGRRVFLTGHTGFKGTWLNAWLTRLGAEVYGYSLPDDVRDFDALQRALADSRAEVVLHLAAQALVRESYANPIETYATNVMGTVHLLEALRSAEHVRGVVVVTSDKCYDNREWLWPYRENEPLGGRDPYSSSKACQELVTAAYRASFSGAAIATARAGNVIGGGDEAKDRLVPDLIRAFTSGESAMIRNPASIRPWQHVLEPLHGYLMLAEGLCEGEGFAEAWNFGPMEHDVRSVRDIADALVARWGAGAKWEQDESTQPHEARMLKLDSSKARARLGWMPRLSLDTALDWIVEWHQHDDPRAATLEQIERYEALLP
ncbi:MAG TPA: CDP-glucose 4,6-dehydratase [Thermoanaerobaculia bacterium]|nr:CDP-glucose 4,6-dehydratase [Thermoanaerobaculia bacterium]